MFNSRRTTNIFGHRFHANVSDLDIIHKVPKIPIMIDEKECDPRTVTDLNGLPLHSMIDQEALDGKMLKIFTSPLVARGFVKDGNLKLTDSGQRPSSTYQYLSSPSWFNGVIEFYEDVNLGGCEWRFTDSVVWDFTKEWACGFLWWGWKNLNDQASSVDVWILPPITEFILCEHINFGGSWAHFSPQGRALDLGVFGWDDRASSYRTGLF